MALSDPLTLTVSGTDTVFVKTRTNADGATRMNEATELTTPELLVIRHQVQGKGNAITDRHLLQLSRAERDSESGVIHTAQMNVSIVIPRVGLFSTAEVIRLFALQKELLTDANLARVLRGES